MSSRSVTWYDKDFNLIERQYWKEINVNFKTFCKWKKEISESDASDNLIDKSIISFFDNIISTYKSVPEPDFSNIEACNYIKSKIKEKFGVNHPNGTIVNFSFLGNEGGEGYFIYIDKEIYSFQEPDSLSKKFNFCWTPKQLLTFDKIVPGYRVTYDNPIWLDYDKFFHQINKENIVKHEDECYLKITYKDDVYYLGNWRLTYEDENIIEDILEGKYNIFFVKKDGNIA